MKLIFIRHGEAEHNLPNWQGGTDNFKAQLTENGRQAVLRSAKELGQFEFVAAYASPMLRTQQTAKLVLNLQKSAPKLQTDDRLADIYISNKLNSRWRGWERMWRLRLRAYPRQHREAQLAKHKLVGGQSLGETMDPIANFSADLRQKHQTGPVLVVAHLHTFWALTSRVGGGQLTDILDAKNFLPPANWREMEI